MEYIIRSATIEDSEVILDFIKELAAYENLEDKVAGSVDDIKATLFCKDPKANVLILEVEGLAAGFCLFFYNYSTFLCKYGIYIEDIYVREHYRGRGFGKMLLKHICKIAEQQDCGRIEWWCLDWNKPSIDFYLKLGAEAMTDWTVYRLNQQEVIKLANE